MSETPRAAAAFAEYCALGPGRSLAKLAAQLGDSPSKIRSLKRQYEVWSSEHNWVERVKAYDRERAEERRIARDAAIEEMNQRHAELARQAQSKATKQIKDLIDAKAFGSVASVSLLKLGLDAERLALGAPTERSELTGKDGEPLTSPTAAQVTIWIPDNGRDNYAGQPLPEPQEQTPQQEGGDA